MVNHKLIVVSPTHIDINLKELYTKYANEEELQTN